MIPPVFPHGGRFLGLWTGGCSGDPGCLLYSTDKTLGTALPLHSLLHGLDEVFVNPPGKMNTQRKKQRLKEDLMKVGVCSGDYTYVCECVCLCVRRP